MPNIPVSEQDAVKANELSVKTPGQLTYLITLALIHWFAQHPRYELIHSLYKDFVIDPKHNQFIKKLETELAGVFTVADIRAAAGLAYLEFHRRIVARYEDIKVQINGELPEYLELYKLLDSLHPAHIKEAVAETEEQKLDKEIEPHV